MRKLIDSSGSVTHHVSRVCPYYHQYQLYDDQDISVICNYFTVSNIIIIHYHYRIIVIDDNYYH